MIHCLNCGVELEENANFCSLCGEPLPDRITDNPAVIKSQRVRKEERLLTDYQKLSGVQKRKIFWTISGIILISGIVITVLIDFIKNQDISWSKYPATVSLILYVNITLNTFLQKKIIPMLSISFLSVLALFILLDFYVGDTGWEIKLGVPVLMAAYVIIFVFIQAIRNSRQKGLNIIAYSLIAAGLICGCIDMIISIFARNSLSLGWSLIVMVSVLFISMLLLYIHYRLKKVTDLQRFFHL